MNKSFDRRNHDEPAGRIDFRYQGGDKGDLKAPIRCVDYKPVLGATGDQIGDLTHSIAIRVSDLETDEVFGPVLVFTQFTALGGDHVVAPDRLSGHPRIDTGEF